MSVLRDATPADVEAIMDVQQEASVRALSGIFPQDRYPFPRAELTARWADEIADPTVRVLVILAHGQVAGYVAVKDDQLLHFGTATSTWGTGLAAAAHAEILELFSGEGRLWVLAGNRRARRFYEKMGWQATGRCVPEDFPPHPELVEYHLPAGSRRSSPAHDAT
ncbi:GNAT family N-acetyltransferase [Actinoplanes xinjiangensis]|uniref:Putative acetyltransferase n=1 Tax=Actinoplanes xinjiangensis TaxID=512350 RepID=A0A316F6L1_9ACTN|nr:GNAT family N-acetyltransferase [Actinoplanes xinjiangensis]PWK41174.1 putative acetyltransferase [Actinoplanes xinjiangensis]